MKKECIFVLPCFLAVAITIFINAWLSHVNTIGSYCLLLANVEALSEEEVISIMVFYEDTNNEGEYRFALKCPLETNICPSSESYFMLGIMDKCEDF